MGADDLSAHQGVTDSPVISSTGGSDLDDSYDIYKQHATDEPTDPAEAKRVLRKIDKRVVFILFLIYLLQYLDKNGINYASVYGLQAGTHLHGQQYSWLSSICTLSKRSNPFVSSETCVLETSNPGGPDRHMDASSGSCEACPRQHAQDNLLTCNLQSGSLFWVYGWPIPCRISTTATTHWKSAQRYYPHLGNHCYNDSGMPQLCRNRHQSILTGSRRKCGQSGLHPGHVDVV